MTANDAAIYAPGLTTAEHLHHLAEHAALLADECDIGTRARGGSIDGHVAVYLREYAAAMQTAARALERVGGRSRRRWRRRAVGQ